MAKLNFLRLIGLILVAVEGQVTSADQGLEGQIPSDGFKFYRDYLIKSVPVYFEKAAIHWPATRLWRDLSYLKTAFVNETVTVRLKVDQTASESSLTLHETLSRCRKLGVLCSYTTPPSSSMLRDIYLPPFLQCSDLNKNMETIKFQSDFSGSSREFSIAPDDVVVTALSGKKTVELLNTSALIRWYNKHGFDIMELFETQAEEQSDRMLQTVKHFGITVNLKAGDILFIPQHWLYRIHQLNTAHNIDAFISIGFLPYHSNIEKMLESSANFMESVSRLEEIRQALPTTVACAENVIPLSQSLKVSKNENETLHLRIPKRRRRPSDVLLASGYTLPPIGFGTGLLFDKTTDAVKTALSYGFRLFDVAQAYGEKGTAAGIREFGIPRSEFFLITKLHPKYLGFQTTLDAIKKSLENLETHYIDVFLIHSKHCDDFLLKCGENEPNGTWQESWKAMEEAHKLGWVRSLGVSNFNLEDLKALIAMAKVPVSVLQNWFDPLHQDTKVREFCAAHNISYQGYSTLGSQWVHSYGLSYNPILTSDLILNIAAHYDYVASHVVLRYAIHKGVTPITSSANPNHIGQSFRSLDISLHPSEIEAIDEFDVAMTQALNELDESLSSKEAEDDASSSVKDKNADGESKEVEAIADKSSVESSAEDDESKVDESVNTASDGHVTSGPESSEHKVEGKKAESTRRKTEL